MLQSMGLDKEAAAKLAEQRLAEWRRLGYDQWHRMLDTKEHRQVIAEDGKRYTVVSYGIDDGDGRIRLCVAVDDGGWSAFVPPTRDEIMRPDGSFLT